MPRRGTSELDQALDGCKKIGLVETSLNDIGPPHHPSWAYPNLTKSDRWNFVLRLQPQAAFYRFPWNLF